MTTLYGITNCDTVKRARQWLDAHGVAYTFHDFKRAGVTAEHLRRWIAAAGWERVLNRQGTTYRKLDEPVRGGVVDAPSAAAVMRDQPSAIKRPVVEWSDGAVTIGFDAADWARRVDQAKESVPENAL